MRWIQSQAIDQLLLRRPIKRLELRQHRQISISVDCAIFTMNPFPFSFRWSASTSVWILWFNVSRNNFPPLFLPSPPPSLRPAHKVNFREKPEREAKRKAESKLQFKVFSNEQSEPFSSLSLSDFAFTRCFTSCWLRRSLAGGRRNYLSRGWMCLSHLTIFSSNL